jgi:hypothetical protein
MHQHTTLQNTALRAANCPFATLQNSNLTGFQQVALCGFFFAHFRDFPGNILTE